MNKENQTYTILMVIGILSILSGIYGLYNGSPFESYFFGIFIGLSIIGVAYYNRMEQKKKQNEDE